MSSELVQVRVSMPVSYLQRFRQIKPEVVSKLGYSEARWEQLLKSQNPAQTKEIIEVAMKYLELLEQDAK